MNDMRTVPEKPAIAARPTEQPTGLGWALWAVAAALPWLLPTHSEPWTTFYGEWSMAAVLTTIAVWAVVAAHQAWKADLVVGAILGMACIPLIQALGGMFTFPGEALLVGLYLTGIGLTVFVARHVEEARPWRLIDALFASLVMAALASTGMALYQWQGLDEWGVLVANAGAGGRPVANVGQANNLSTVLVWGLVGIWWGHARQRLGGGVAMLAAAFLLMGIALTQSRTGWLAVGAVFLVALCGSRGQTRPLKPLALVALAVWFVMLVLGLQAMTEWTLREAPLTLTEQVAPGKRPMIWQMAIEAILQHPWLGYGWNQSVQAHLALSDQYPSLHTTIQFAHNVVLDLLLWNGLPVGALVVGASGLWLWRQTNGPMAQERRILLAALGVFVLHAMLELPHALAFFLLPAAVMVGTLSAWRPVRELVRVPRIAVGLVVLIHAGLLLLIFNDYQRIETDRMAYLMRMARIGDLTEKPAPDVRVLGSLQSPLLALRLEPKRGMSGLELAELRNAATRYPGGLLRYARAAALNGLPDEANWALAVYCRVRSSVDCLTAADTWRALIANGNPEMADVVLPPGMSRYSATDRPQ